MQRRKGRRRKPGELWDRGRVHEWAADGRASAEVGGALGYLVTRNVNRFPEPVAFVAGDGRTSLILARLAQVSPRRAAGYELTTLCGMASFPPRLCNLPFFPVEVRGRLIPARGAVTGGQYAAGDDGRSVGGFCGYVHNSVRCPRNKERGTPAVPVAPAPGSKEGDEARALTAA